MDDDEDDVEDEILVFDDDGDGIGDDTPHSHVPSSIPDNMVPAMAKGERREARVRRITRWRRTIVVTGSPEWVDRTRKSSLAQGVHQVGIRDGIPCLIEVVEDESEALRHLSGPVPNEEMVRLRQTDPAGYEAIHGPGTAISHADYGERDKNDKTTTVDSPVGQYL